MVRVLVGLGHRGLIIAVERFSNYFGARFVDRMVVRETLECGTALPRPYQAAN